ncbi:MAG: hypothetical protein PHR35_03190 [Kiritimatiellae bacterium]|nr:hypothetical protein [Kiritimatiellia bacterium]
MNPQIPSNETDVPRNYPGRLCFYHANANGNGAAVRFELKTAQGEREGCFFMVFARQKTLPERNGGNGRQTATFDWNGKITVKFGFSDICNLLLVLTGRCEQAGGGRGLFHDTADANTVIALRRQQEPAGYALEVSRKPKHAGAEVSRMRVLLAEAEALGLKCIFEQALLPIVFWPLGRSDSMGTAPCGPSAKA